MSGHLGADQAPNPPGKSAVFTPEAIGDSLDPATSTWSNKVVAIDSSALPDETSEQQRLAQVEFEAKDRAAVAASEGKSPRKSDRTASKVARAKNMRLSAVNAANDAVDTDSSDSSWTVEDAPVESPDSQDSNTLSKREHGNLNRQAKADLAKLADEAKKEAQKSGASTALADRVEADGDVVMRDAKEPDGAQKQQPVTVEEVYMEDAGETSNHTD